MQTIHVPNSPTQDQAPSLFPPTRWSLVIDAKNGSESMARRVVILNSVDPYLPAYISLDDALREAIRAGRKTPVELYAEPLDMGRFPRTPSWNAMMQELISI